VATILGLHSTSFLFYGGNIFSFHSKEVVPWKLSNTSPSRQNESFGRTIQATNWYYNVLGLRTFWIMQCGLQVRASCSPRLAQKLRVRTQTFMVTSPRKTSAQKCKPTCATHRFRCATMKKCQENSDKLHCGFKYRVHRSLISLGSWRCCVERKCKWPAECPCWWILLHIKGVYYDWQREYSTKKSGRADSVFKEVGSEGKEDVSKAISLGQGTWMGANTRK
jgi:hypothetical protein